MKEEGGDLLWYDHPRASEAVLYFNSECKICREVEIMRGVLKKSMTNHFIDSHLRFLVVLIVLICTTYSQTGFCQEQKIFFANFAPAGQYQHLVGHDSNGEEVAQYYPYIARYCETAGVREECSQGVSSLTCCVPVVEELRQRALKLAKTKKNLVIKELADVKAGEGLVVALVLDNETVGVTKIEDSERGDVFRVIADVGAQLLVFDYIEKRVISSYPIAVRYLDGPFEEDPRTVNPTKRSPVDAAVREAFLGSEGERDNVVSEFFRLLGSVPIEKKLFSTIQVTDVIIEEKALPYLPPCYKEDLASFKAIVAKNFTKHLSANQGVSVLPCTKGHDIGGEMALRFDNVGMLNLELPPPDFEVQIVLRGFQKKLWDQQKAGASWVFGAFVNIRVANFESRDTLGEFRSKEMILDVKVKDRITKIIPATVKLGPDTVENDWRFFQGALYHLFDNLTQDFSTKKVYKQMRGVLENCNM